MPVDLVLTPIFRYDILNNSWVSISPLPRALSHMGGCISLKENLIFLSGGYEKYEATNQVCSILVGSIGD